MVRRMSAVLVVTASAIAGCHTLQAAASKDPLKCERDPSCARRYDKSRDCARQCADDPECMKRCESMQRGVDRGP